MTVVGSQTTPLSETIFALCRYEECFCALRAEDMIYSHRVKFVLSSQTPKQDFGLFDNLRCIGHLPSQD